MGSQATGGGGKTGQDNQSEGPPSSKPPLRKNSRNANAALEYLQPVAEREARNLQNFFSLLGLLEEEEVLEPEEGAEKEPLFGDCLDD